ncbi:MULTISPECIES: glycosyltransferase [Cohnella]|uniref:glycosyltransferase n=1 Tax=Cohnella TaxID=329857 RepID=UPI001F07A899|nr:MULTISPECIES: glycosyltransferase [Cohnella]
MKKVLIPFIPQSMRKRLKKKVIDRAFSLEKLDIRSTSVQHLNITGINLIGYARAEMGIGESCRIAAKCISTTSIPFDIINFKGTNTARMTDMSWRHKEVEAPQYNVNIFHVNAEQMVEVYTHFGQSLFEKRYNIGYWHWELPEFPDEWLDGFKFVNEVWVPTSFVAESVSAKSNVPVSIIPHGIEVKIENPRNRSYFQLPERSFLFLTMYDMNSFQERKNPIASIEAFKKAFQPDDSSVGLIVKVNNAGSNKEDMKQLLALVTGYVNIYILKETFSRNDTNALIQCADSYISLHRSEGFGLGLAEAMYLGKPAIGTNWSANTDFMNEENSCPVRYRLKKIGKDYGPYTAEQIWADPDIEHAGEYMVKLVNDSGFYDRISMNGMHSIKTDFSPQAVGTKVEKRLKEISDQLGGRL